MTEVPSPAEFAEQLLMQLFNDLDGLLSDGDTATADARALLQREGAAGAVRGASLVLATRAGCEAYRRLLAVPMAIEPIDVFAELFSELLDAAPALFRQAQRLAAYLHTAEPDGETVEQSLAESMFQLYDGLRERQEAQSARGLVSLRAQLVHLDAAAQRLDAGAAAEPALARVLRPDRFRDQFLGLVEDLSRRQSGETPVAALTRDGRLTAILTDERHPIEAAVNARRESLGRDEAQREAGVARMLALIDAIDRLRRGEGPPLGDFTADALLYDALLTAAATTPLAGGEARFHLPALAQVARFNYSLMAPHGGARH